MSRKRTTTGNRNAGGDLADMVRRANEAATAGDFERAASLFRAVHRRRPRDPSPALALGRCLVRLGRLAEAGKVLRKAVKHTPDLAPAWLELTTVYAGLERDDEALAAVDEALRREPDNPQFIAAKANVLSATGRHEEAAEALRPALERDPGEVNLALALANAAPGAGEVPRAVEALDRALASPDAAPPLRTTAMFALGRLLDSSGDYDRAFDVIQKANRSKPVRFDPDAFEAAVSEMIGNWSRESAEASPRVDQPGSERIMFIVGMPRSGTSLVEQILGAHPAVRACGELTLIREVVDDLTGGFNTSGTPLLTDPSTLDEPRLRRAAKQYLADVAARDRSAERFTDKMPSNLLHLGLISRMLPDAKVIHVQRDPLDACLSCYFHEFGSGNAFAYDLEHLARFRRCCEALMAHWRTVLDVAIHEISYEALVENPETGVREMLDDLGLAWDEGCLRFHESNRVARTASRDQVRRPITNSSIGRWRRYEGRLGPLQAALTGS